MPDEVSIACRRRARRRRRQPRHGERRRRDAAARRRGPASTSRAARGPSSGASSPRRSRPTRRCRANVTNELGVGGTHPPAQERHRAVAARGVPARCGATAGSVHDVAALVGGGRGASRAASVDRPRRPALRPAAATCRTRSPRACRASGQPVPATPAGGHARASSTRWRSRAGARSRTIERVSGGAPRSSTSSAAAPPTACSASSVRSALERPVLAGPAEATVVGNALVQAIAAGVVADLDTGGRSSRRRCRHVGSSPARSTTGTRWPPTCPNRCSRTATTQPMGQNMTERSCFHPSVARRRSRDARTDQARRPPPHRALLRRPRRLLGPVPRPARSADRVRPRDRAAVVGVGRRASTSASSTPRSAAAAPARSCSAPVSTSCSCTPPRTARRRRCCRCTSAARPRPWC